MREILFRGKRTANGVFVEGFLFLKQEGDEIRTCIGIDPLRDYPDGELAQGCYFEINPSTVGQYIGITDKNGKKIFDGDILVFCKGATHPIQVFWDGLGWKFLRNGKRIEDAFECNTISHIQYCEVIGNIHDNPELFETA